MPLTKPKVIQRIPTQRLWRYMDITKYLSLIQTQKLFFSRMDKFDDPYEWKITPYTKEIFKRDWNEAVLQESPEPYPQEQLDTTVGRIITYAEQHLKKQYANCWHENDSENYAMWKIYSRYEEGVAVVTNPERMKKAFENSGLIDWGCVEYFHEAQNVQTIQNFTRLCFSKRHQFGFEKEVRLVTTPLPNEPFPKYGMMVKVDLQELIDCVYISPKAPDWFKDIIESLNEAYGLKNKTICQSTINLII